MKLAAPVLIALLLSLIEAAYASPWRKAQSNAAAGSEKNAVTQKAASQLSAQSVHSPSALHADSSASPDSHQVLPQMTAWLKQASDHSSLHKFDCSSDALSGWTSDCDALSVSEEHRSQLAALLTVCHHQRNSKAAIPIECLQWLRTAVEVDNCIE